MPFGIIDVETDKNLAGTELLIKDDSTDSSVDVDTSHLKRVMWRGVDTILIPQPSETDPNDPLLWPTWKKELAFAIVFFNNIIFAAVPGPLLAPSTFALAAIFGVPLTAIAELSGYQLLIVGAIGPIVSVLAQKYGKRPQFLFAAVMGTVGTIICIAGAEQFNYNMLLAGRMVQGLGCTAWESLSLAAVGDMFYLHERGWRTALMVATLTCTPSMTSIIAGVMTENTGWQTMFIASLPFDLVGLLGAVFFLPETQFRRDSPKSAAIQETTETKTNTEQKDGEGEASIIETANPSTTPTVQKKSFTENLRVFTGSYSTRSIPHLLIEIFVHLLNPAVIWIQLVSGVLIALFVTSAYITAQIWSVPPYNLNVAQNGYFYTGGFLGGFGATIAGPMCDWAARVLSRLNRGIFEAEFRIPINIFGVFLTALGWFLFMWDVNNPRPNGYILGAFFHGLVCFGISIPSTSAGLYILDSFPKQSTEVFVLQMMLKNFLFYAFSTFINTWAGEKGPGDVFKVNGITSICLLATCIPMYIFGKVNRKFMRDVHEKRKIFRAIG